MKQHVSSFPVKSVVRGSAKACLVAAVVLTLCVAGNESVQATAGPDANTPGDPYVVPTLTSSGGVLNVSLEAVLEQVNIGNGVKANVMAFKKTGDAHGTLPGPELRLKVGDQVSVHFENHLPSKVIDGKEVNVTGIHWHGIELNNASDGTEVTQPAVAPGGFFDYKFTVTRPGIFWYHPHHHSSTNQVAKGLYGSIIVEDKNGYEATLRNNGVIPSAAQTKTLVLSDITVCSDPGTNPATFTGNLPHVSGIQSWEINYENHRLTQSPRILCDTYPLDENGNLRLDANGVVPYGAGDIPNIQSPSLTGRMSEGFTVLTNGVNVGGRLGSPDNPGDLLSNAVTTPVKAGQGLRLQIVNPSPVRYMRLRLTDSRGWKIPLVRIGGQGGVLNNAVVEGGLTASGFDLKYDRGEILLPPAGRADVVAEIPASAQQGSVLTLWTEDFQRVAATWSWIPTVPVMHLKVSGLAATPYVIGDGRALLASLGAQAMVKALGAATGALFIGVNETGSVEKDIKLTFFTKGGAFEASIDGVPMPRDFTGLGIDGLQASGNPFFLESARHATLSNTMELTVTNTTGAHHPFHLHGFSFQPISLTPRTGINGPSYMFNREFLDIMDVPANYTLRFRVSLDDRPSYGAVSGGGGGNGRWLFHCHILPHATFGMMSELHVH